MRLNDVEQAILAGRQGPVPQLALQHQIKVGDFFHAEDFVEVTQAHIMADTESLGPAGVVWLESLVARANGVPQMRVPTITDPRGTDFSKAEFLGQTAAMLDLEQRTIDAFVRLGVVCRQDVFPCEGRRDTSQQDTRHSTSECSAGAVISPCRK